MQYKEIDSFDGTRIGYQVGGEGQRWLVFANGYGGNFDAWRDVFARLGHYRLLLWDYRGLHHSERPADISRMTIADNVRDLDALRAAEGIERMVIAGWSVGVQVALEQYRMRRDTVDALVLLNGAHERVLHHSIDGTISPYYLPPLLRAIKTLSPLLDWTVLPILRRLAESPRSLGLLSRAGLITGEPEPIYDVLLAVLRLDYGTYAHMGLLADEHYTEDLLPSIAVPTLVTAAEKDIISPPRIGRHIASQIPGARYREIPGGTHYAVMEFPQLFASLIDEFIDGLPASGRHP